MNTSISINDIDRFEDIRATVSGMGFSFSHAAENGAGKFVIMNTRWGTFLEAMRKEYGKPFDHRTEKLVELKVMVPESMKKHIDEHTADCGYCINEFLQIASMKFLECKDGNPGLLKQIRDNFKTVVN